jgi:ornithine cyclodeaminase/alanine dehydrogenase-like protein (mu-crystallin family)
MRPSTNSPQPGGEAGELIAARDQGLLDPATVVQIGDIANGSALGRRDNQQITFLKSVGNAAEDVAAASIAYQAACQHNQGRRCVIRVNWIRECCMIYATFPC